MKNADKSAMPVTEYDSDPNGWMEPQMKGGISKREHFAVLAMHGLLTASGQHDIASASEIASGSVMHADALLAELERTK